MRVELLINVTSNLDNLYENLNMIESTYAGNPAISYNIALFFIDPWKIEEFCNYRKQFSNVNIFLSETHSTDNINEYLRGKRPSIVRFFSDSDIIDGLLLVEAAKV